MRRSLLCEYLQDDGNVHMLRSAQAKKADSLLYVIGDPIGEAVIKKLNPEAAFSLATYYKEGKTRLITYTEMIEHILRRVRSGDTTVDAFYGHPGVFAYPSHESIRRARLEGYEAKMLPAVSSEDCLFADLGVDPAVAGCQSYQATDFLLNLPIIDPSSQLILWQVGSLGDSTYQKMKYNTSAMPLLVQRLPNSILYRILSSSMKRRCCPAQIR
jgi:hypothetical protein